MERKIIILISLLILSFIMAILFSGCGKKEKTADFEQVTTYQDTQAKGVKAMIDGKDDIILLDVREQSEFDGGHLAGSILIPTGQITSRINELDKNKTIVVICASGSRSSQVAAYLVQNGFTKVKNLVGGMMSWPYPELVVK